MTMILGPVFQAELVGSTRRPRFFVGRFLYGLLVLFIVSTTYYNMSETYVRNGGTIPIHALASFGQAIFASFATLQGIVFLVMTPSLVAGAIADEKQRKTLHYLMASELSSTEIILGKIGARLLRMAVLGLIGLPVLALVGLFGGIDYSVVLLVYSATATTTFFLASLAILCSVHATKPREAIMQCFFIEFLWLVIPTFVLTSMPFWNVNARVVGEFLAPAIEWVAASSPLTFSPRTGMMSPASMLEKACWMMGLQVGYGTLFLLVAIARLRPVFRGMDGPGLWARLRRKGMAKRPRMRLFRRPPIGDDAMLWKELHVNRVSDSRKIVLSLLCVGLLGLTVYLAWDYVSGAVREALYSGYWNYGTDQQTINGILRGGNAVGLVILLIGLAATAASSITAEREGDTWINLAASPVEGVELVRGKLLGSLYVFRPIAYTLLASWVFGLLVGSVRPLGVLACLTELLVFAWFVASLGVAVSLRAKNTVQSMAVTFALGMFCNVGYLILLGLVMQGGRGNLAVMGGCMPFIFVVSLVGSSDFTTGSREFGEIVTACIGGTILYALAAAALTYYAVAAYDRIVDRPDRRRNQLTPDRLRALQARPATKTPRPAPSTAGA